MRMQVCSRPSGADGVDQQLSMTLNVVALSALQGFAGNLVKLQQKLSAEPDIQPGTVPSLEKLLRLQSETSSLQDKLSSAGVDFDKLETALTELANDPTLGTSLMMVPLTLSPFDGFVFATVDHS